MPANKSAKKDLKVILVTPRGFCAGVTRAIEIVKKALKKYGKPVYVVHEIVHNRYVVEELKKQGAIFVDSLKEVQKDRPVIFSAHGVAKSVIKEAEESGLNYIEAICPLVKKVHIEVAKNVKEQIKTILIGHKNHAEVIGTKGQAADGEIIVVSSTNDIDNINLAKDTELSYVTQTTLSVDETDTIIDYLSRKFPNLKKEKKSNVCYATSNRQNAVKELAKVCDTIIVIGDPNSSNSKRLVEIAINAGCKTAYLVQNADELDFNKLEKTKKLGITAGASAPEILVKEVIEKLKLNFNLNVEELEILKENLKFKLPKELEE